MKYDLNAVTYKDKTQPCYAWAKQLGISPTTLKRRLEYGWELADAFVPPTLKGAVSKDEAEQALNDLLWNELPSNLSAMVTGKCQTPRYGTWIREHHRKAFDLWYTTVYLPNHSAAL